VERELDLQDECMRGNCGSRFGCTGRVAERVIWRKIGMYKEIG